MSDNLSPNIAASGTSANPPVGQNSSFEWQKPGSSINALSQGVVANTMIAINDSSLMHACDITPDTLYTVYSGTLKLVFGIESARVARLAIWGSESASPIIEAIKNIKTILDNINKTITKYVKYIKDAVEEIKQFIQAIQTLIAFLASLPAKLAELVQNCLTSFFEIIGSIKQAFQDVYDATVGYAIDTVQDLQNSIQDVQTTVTSVSSDLTSSTSSVEKTVTSIVT